jgi:hypothetical protein
MHVLKINNTFAEVKKAIVLILAILYITSSSGATISLHYCMGKLVGWNLGTTEQHSCNNCGMEMNSENGCCKDEHKQVKIDKDQKTAVTFIETLQLNAVSTPVAKISYHTHVLVAHLNDGTTRSNAPPLYGNVSPNILHCVCRI